MGTDTYFIVDDSKFARKMVKKVFDGLGYHCIGEGNNYKETLGLIRKLKSEKTAINFLLLDLVMPEISGDELIPIILELMPETRIIVTTSIADKKTVQRAILAGAKGYILKPITQEKVLETMNIITINELVQRKGS